ncbi:16S rRNA (guanine(527)-N(7))-methyltransferase RsmG [Marinicella sp. W31]|uniref:16S rRNA (guanine(527)-N(7))-methyltransferase RsmG n=1 Tax=Marinicella sp. W31 TaxID=3023713 RepID=UPI003756802D
MNGQDLKKLLHAGMIQLKIDERFQPQLWQYLELLSQWNKAYNLTAITDSRDMITHHVLDSLSVYPFIRGKTILDVGTGGGIPGMILAIVDPQRHYTLIDSIGKKTRFLNQARRQLGLSNVSVVTERVENYSPEQSFDVIISRAFAHAEDFLRWTKHLGDTDSEFLAMKGPRQEQLENMDMFRIEQAETLTVPFLEASRHLYIYKKTSG